jgi:TP901 family phage tail tape measure protein
MLSAAAAEGAEFEQVASVMSNTLNGMGLDKTAKNTQMVADTLTLASARTNSSITSLGESMKNLAPIARQFNIPFKDAVTSVALLQDVGIDASEAGTSMATMLTKLATPTDAIKGKMRALGVEFQDAKGNMMTLPQVFQNFSKAAEKSGGNMKQAAFFAELVGLRGQRAALNMQTMFKSGRFKELADELERAEGKAKEMADLRMDTLGGDLTILGNTVDDLKISLFDMNSGPLRDIVKETTKWITANKGLILGKVQKFISDVVEHMPEIVAWMKRIAIGAAAFYTFSTAVKVAKLSIEAYEVGVKGAALALKGWQLGMKISSTVLAEGAQSFGLFNRQAAEGAKGLAGLRTGLNASELGGAINGVTSKLGQAGLLGAALAVGYAFGTWLNATFELDAKIADIIAKMTGLDEKMAGRNSKQGIQAGEPMEFADGTLISADGRTILKRGTSSERFEKGVAKANFVANEDELSKSRMNPAMRRNFRAMQDVHHADEDAALKRAMDEDMGIVTPQERTARTISETNSTTVDKAEITIKDETGNAKITKPTTGPTRLKMKQSGAM